MLASICTTTAKAQKGTFAATASQENTNRWKDYNRSRYIGIRVGLNVSQLFYSPLRDGNNMGSKAGMNIGVVAGFQLSDDFPLFVEPGLLYSGKGARMKGYAFSGFDAEGEKLFAAPGDINIRTHYLEIPVVFKYKIETCVDDMTVQPFFGGFCSIGMGGTTKYFNTRIKANPMGSNGFVAGDAGLRLGCGIAFQNFYLDMSYDIGLVNIAKNNYYDFHYDNFNDRIHTGCLSITAGVDF